MYSGNHENATLTSNGRRVSMTKRDLSKAADVLKEGSSGSGCSKTRPRPRVTAMPASTFRLQKRESLEDETVVMPSCNSDFLSGIFKDIASATTTLPSAVTANTAATDLTERPNKKTKISMTRSISRCHKSFGNLSSHPSTCTFLETTTPAVSVPASPESNRKAVTSTASDKGKIRTKRSLPYFSSMGNNVSEYAMTTDGLPGKIAFPRLPATVSSSSFSNTGLMSRTNSGLQLPDSENSNNANDKSDCYGWFVEMDADEDRFVPSTTLDKTRFPTSVSATSLAFSAATAPKGTDYDAEVQWAQAADTVDDVLGDFF